MMNWNADELAIDTYRKLNAGLWGMGYLFVNRQEEWGESLTSNERFDSTPLSARVVTSLMTDYAALAASNFNPVVALSVAWGTGIGLKNESCLPLFKRQEQLYSVCAECMIQSEACFDFEDVIWEKARQHYEYRVRDVLEGWAKQRKTFEELASSGVEIAYGEGGATDGVAVSASTSRPPQSAIVARAPISTWKLEGANPRAKGK